MYANSVLNITTKALRPNEMYFNISFCHELTIVSLELLLYFSRCKNECYNKMFVFKLNRHSIVTFSKSNATMVDIPKRRSQMFVPVICLKTLIQDSMKPFVEPFKPNNDFT